MHKLLLAILMGRLLVGCAVPDSTNTAATATPVRNSPVTTSAPSASAAAIQTRPAATAGESALVAATAASISLTTTQTTPSPTPAATIPTPTATEVDGLNDDHLEQIAAEYRSLRPTPGQFGGGLWNEDVDQWMGRKHKLMLELSSRLSGAQRDQAAIVQLLGPPDRIERAGDTYFELATSEPGLAASASEQAEILIYYWRGTHDFLYFVKEGETVIGSDWWLANE